MNGITATAYLSALSSIAFAMVATAVILGIVVVSLFYVWKITRNLVLGYRRHVNRIKKSKAFNFQKEVDLKVVKKEKVAK